MDHQLTCASPPDEDEVEPRFSSRLRATYSPSTINPYMRPRVGMPPSPQRHPITYADFPTESRFYRTRGHATNGDCDVGEETRGKRLAYYSGDMANAISPGRHFHNHSASDPVRHAKYYVSPEDRSFTTAEVHRFPSSENISNAENYARKKSSHSRAPNSNRSSTYREEFYVEAMSSRFAAMVASEEENSPLKWNRNNIAATMERFEPLEYCYAYKEEAIDHNLAVPSTSRCNPYFLNSPKSAPSKCKPKHSFVNRYGTEENIYEEISDKGKGTLPKQRHPHQQSLISLNQSMMEEELRRVENRHKRILGELNLSVEAMLMPESESAENERAENGETHVGPTDDLLSPSSCNPLADLDSGFSGSSSGASYVGSLRLKNGLERARSSLSFPRDVTAPDANSERCSRTLSSNSPSARSSSCGDSGKNNGFWSKKNWKKIPGFSSSSTINKTGLTVSPGENWWLRWIP